MPNMDALNTLLRRQPSNDPYVTRRRAEITSGFDDMVPDADSVEMKLAQGEIANQTGWAPARDEMRQGPMAALRQRFGMAESAHQQEMERGAQKGEYAIAAQREAAKAQAGRLRFSQEQIGSRQEQNQAAIMERLERGQTKQDTRQEDAQQHKVENPTGGASTTVPTQLYGQVTDAQGSYNGPMNRLKRTVGMDGGSREYESSLANILDRQGNLDDATAIASGLARYKGSLDERIAQSAQDDTFEFDLSALDPYTRQYLELKVR